MGAPMGNRNAAGKHTGGLGITHKKARRGRAILGSTKNQIKNFSKLNKRKERIETYKSVSSKTKKILKNVRKGQKTRRLSKGLSYNY